MKKNNKVLAGLLIGGVIATSGALVGCGNNEKPILNSTTDVYGFAGVTTGLIASAAPVKSASEGEIVSQDATTDFIKDIKNTISTELDKYMQVFDSVIGGKKPINVEVQGASELTYQKDGSPVVEKYSNKLVVNIEYLSNDKTSYELYFNETLLNDDNEKIEDSDKEERETKLEGKMVIDGKDGNKHIIAVSGKKELDPNENETEVEFKAYLDDAKKNYIEFKQEKSEQDGEKEEEYVFNIVADGKVVESFEFGLERNKKGDIEVEIAQKVGLLDFNFEVEKKDGKIYLETVVAGTELSIEVTVTPKNPERPEEGNCYHYSIPEFNIDFSGSLTF